jgi:tetratricopeptide (TPR) repeat protein
LTAAILLRGADEIGGARTARMANVPVRIALYSFLVIAAAGTCRAQTRPSMTSEAELVEQLESAVGKGGYEAGLSLLQGKVKSEPRNGVARFFLATAYQAKQRYSECIEEISASRKLNIVDDRLMGILWVCLDESGSPEEAFNTAAEAVQRYPNSGESHRWFGVSLSRERRFAEARSQFKQALRFDPEDATALYMLAQLYRTDGYIVPSFLTYMRFLASEPGGERAAKARKQLKALFDTKLVLKFIDSSTVEAEVSLGTNTPSDEGDFEAAQKAMAVYGGSSTREPDLTVGRLAQTLRAVLSALPTRESVSNESFAVRVLAPYLLEAQSRAVLNGLAALAITGEGVPEADEFLRWNAAHVWENQ